jgi:hypothetical protein
MLGFGGRQTMNKLLEDLKVKFPMKEFSPYGFCVVIPGAEFDPDWEAELGDQGYKCFDTDFEGEPVTLVRVVKAEKGQGEKTVYSPPPAPKASAETAARMRDSRSRWSEEEDEVLVKLWNDRVPIEKMPPSIPSRTEAAIRLRIQRLEKHGTIEKRSGRGRPKFRPDYSFKKKFPRKIIDFAVELSKSVDPAYSARDIAGKIFERFGAKVSHAAVRNWIMDAASPVDASADKSVDTPIPTRIPTSVPTPSSVTDEVVELLKQILQAVKPKEELVRFEAYCPGCRDSRSVEDSNVWKACPVCGGPLIVWNVDPGRECPS